MEFVKTTIAENPVVIFGKSYCPFCIKAVRFIGNVTEGKFLNIDLDKYVFGADFTLDARMVLKFRLLYMR